MEPQPYATDPEQRRRRRSFPISRLFPNMVTIAGLCCGITAVRFAMLERWELAVALLVGAAILDAMDGMIARMLKATSAFGAQLDSLADVISFGVSPAIMYYLWALEDFRRYGWAAVLFFIACCALRLARFNVGITREQRYPFEKLFFTGVPAPAGALLAVTPIIISFNGWHLLKDYPYLGALYLIVIGALMASRIPTVALKNIRIGQEYVPYILIGVALLLAFLIIEPWLVMPAIALIYLISIPFSAARYYRLKHAAER